MSVTHASPGSALSRSGVIAPVSRARPLLLAVIAIAAAAALLATDSAAAHRAATAAGADLTRLLRAMAAIKAVMAGAAATAVLWRLGMPTSLSWFSAYAAACAAMAAGPALIWNMVHVTAGSVLLHGGLLAGLVLLWRDPAVSRRLAAMVAERRARHSAGQGARP